MANEKEKRLILASGSPRRNELLAKLGIPFEVVVPGVSEDVETGIDPREMVLMLAERKARAVGQNQPQGLIIGSDTTIAFGGRVLGKPRDKDDAIEILKSLRAKSHEVLSGIAVLDASIDRIEKSAVKTTIKMRNYTDAEISDYVLTGEPMDKAGAYAIQGEGRKLIEDIQGPFDNVMGLPLRELAELLKRFGLEPDTRQIQST